MAVVHFLDKEQQTRSPEKAGCILIVGSTIFGPKRRFA